MAFVTREQAIDNLNRYVGKDLRELSELYSITTFETGRQNKGWKGLVLERLAGLDNSNIQAPDGISFELKSVSYHKKGTTLKPKETMAITMINPYELAHQDFYDSYCWHKLRSMVFCAVMWHGPNSEKAELVKVIDFDFSKTDELTLQIKGDYDFIRHKLVSHGFDSLTGKDGKWIQARTKGPGHGSISRAFYAKTCLLERIIGNDF